MNKKLKDLKCEDFKGCIGCPFELNCDWIEDTQLTFGENLEILKEKLDKEYEKVS